MNNNWFHKLINRVPRTFRSQKEPRIEKMIDIENVRALSTATMTVAVTKLLFLLCSRLFHLGELSTSTPPGRVLICAASCIVTSLLLRLYLRRLKRSKAQKRDLGPIFLGIFFLFMAAMSVETDLKRYQIGDQMLFFYTVQFCFLLFTSIKPYRGLLMSTITFFWFCTRIALFDNGANFNYTSCFILYFLAVFGNAVKYNARVAHYKNTIAMQIQREEQDIVIAQSGKCISIYDLKKNVVYNDPKAVRLLGLSERIHHSRNGAFLATIVMPDSLNAALDFFSAMREGIPNGKGDFQVKTAEGAVVWLHGDYTLQADNTGTYVNSIISFSDVTEQMEQRRIHDQRISEILSLTGDCDFYAECSMERWVVNDIHMVTDRMWRAPSAKGQDIDEVLEKNWKPIVHKEDYVRLKEFFSKSRLQLLNVNGISTDKIEFRLTSGKLLGWYCIELCLVRSANSSELNFFAIFKDINALRTQHDQLVSRATLDKLTGLYNREATMQAIEDFLAGEGASGTHALIMLDLDNLKKVNDRLGHQIGDEALRKVGECLKKTFRHSDICGRMGGDEFFAFLKNIGVEKVISKAKSILSELQIAYSSNGEQVITSTSMGIAIYHGALSPRKTLGELYAQADAALYKSKALGKNTFTFADEMDTLAVSSASPATFLKNDLISYNLRGLFDNLANGIAIFHGTPPNQLTPVFCNSRLPELLDISQEQFFQHMSVANNYGIHPEDLGHAREIFLESLENRGSVRDTFRLLTGSGSYRYVTVFSNVHPMEDGCFDLYCIFSDAEEAEHLRRIQENSRRQLQKKRLLATENDVAYALLNISKNLCVERYYTHLSNQGTRPMTTAEELINEIAQDIALKESREEFSRRFSLEALRRDASEGMVSKEMRIPFLRENRSAQWYQLSSELSFNPDTGDMELFITFTDIDNEVRLGYVINRVLDSEYECLFQIDVHSGYIQRIGDTEERRTESPEHRALYSQIIQQGAAAMIPEEYREAGLEAMSMERILQELEAKERYTVVFPFLNADGKGERLCQWSCEYMDDARDTILMTRINISRYLDYGYDSLTGVLNRKGFYRQVRNTLDLEPDRRFCLLEFDFDNFKLINDEQGYDEGNRLLRRFAADIRQRAKLLGNSNWIGRFEADHFAFLLPLDGGISPEELYKQIALQVSAYSHTSRIKLSMGAYLIENPALDAAIMCDCAHLAHKYCKNSHTTKIQYYSDALRDKLLEDQFLLSELQAALDAEQFEVWFQPQVNHADNGSLIGAEALVRWRHPEKGIISPGVFIPLFEQNGSVYQLDKYVWEHSCRHIRRWLDNGDSPMPISVNVSRLDLLQNDFTDTIVSIVQRYEIPHELLHLEVTESAFSEDTGKVIGAVKKLISLGFTVAIDDFGSGYSSLSLLESVPAHILKLDMRFFQNSGDTLRNECIIEAVVRMAKMLGMAVLAEGVEKMEQADFLCSVGCNYIQGFLYAKPMPPTDYVEYAKRPDNTPLIGPTPKSLEELQSERNQSYELFRSILSGSSDIIVVADIHTKRLLYANQAAEQYYNKGFDPLVPTTCTEYCNQMEFCKNCPATTLEPGERRELVQIHNGRHMRAHYTRMEWNGHDAFVFYLTDISAEMRELELADSLLRNIPGAIIVFSLSETGVPEVRYASKQAQAFFALAGIHGETPRFKDLASVTHPEDAARIQAAARLTFSAKQPFSGEYRVMLQDGGIMWINLTVNPVVDANGGCLFYGIYTDVTDRKNAQVRADTLIRSIPTALTIYEVSGHNVRRIFISDNVKRILSAPEDRYDTVEMEDIFQRIHPQDRQKVRSIVGESIARREPFSVCFQLKTEDVHPRWVQLDSTPIEEKTDGTLYYYSIYTDISAQKRLESGINERSSLQNIQEVVSLGLQEATRQLTPALSIEYIIGFVGRVLHGERAYIFEKNPDGTDSNTFEWVAQGIAPEKDNLQNIPGEVSAPWYEQFREQRLVIVDDMDDVQRNHPQLYEALALQGIRSLVVAPLFDDHGEPMGFFGLDNPPAGLLRHNSTLVRSIAYFVEAALKRLRLEDDPSVPV